MNVDDDDDDGRRKDAVWCGVVQRKMLIRREENYIEGATCSISISKHIIGGGCFLSLIFSCVFRDFIAMETMNLCQKMEIHFRLPFHYFSRPRNTWDSSSDSDSASEN